MKLSAVVLVVLASVAIGCSQPASPAGPSSAVPRAATAARDTVGGSEKTTPTVVPFKGRLQGEADPPVFGPPRRVFERWRIARRVGARPIPGERCTP